jgi:seryl-tRNA synthetase
MTPSKDSMQAIKNLDMEIDFELKKISLTVDEINKRQEQMASDIKQIKDAVYNPETGLYARIKQLENWKNGVAKVLWSVATTTLGLLVVTVWKLITTK